MRDYTHAPGHVVKIVEAEFKLRLEDTKGFWLSDNHLVAKYVVLLSIFYIEDVCSTVGNRKIKKSWYLFTNFWYYNKEDVIDK